MDWRGRKYYVVTFPLNSYDMRIDILKNIDRIRLQNIDRIRLHSPNKHDFNIKLPDEKEPRGHYHVLIGCNINMSEIVEYELRKAERRDGALWKEVQQDTSKKYFDIYGQEMPYRKCDLNPNKRCNHCMNC